MNHLGTLSPRHFDVLHAIVQSYIETGEPVASRTIACKYPMSSASIRNMMADLLDKAICPNLIPRPGAYRRSAAIRAT